MPYRVYLVEDHSALREAYTELIGTSGDLVVVGAAGSAEAAILDLNGTEADVALVDVSLGDPGARMHGIHLVGQLHRLWPRLRVLVVSSHDEALYAERALTAGARGYLMKHEAGPQLIAAIHRVLHGEVVLSDLMQASLPPALCSSIDALHADPAT